MTSSLYPIQAFHSFHQFHGQLWSSVTDSVTDLATDSVTDSSVVNELEMQCICSDESNVLNPSGIIVFEFERFIGDSEYITMYMSDSLQDLYRKIHGIIFPTSYTIPPISTSSTPVYEVQSLTQQSRLNTVGVPTGAEGSGSFQTPSSSPGLHSVPHNYIRDIFSFKNRKIIHSIPYDNTITIGEYVNTYSSYFEPVEYIDKQAVYKIFVIDSEYIELTKNKKNNITLLGKIQKTIDTCITCIV